MKLIDYLSGDRRGGEARDLELEAQRDPLLAEALQGFEENPGDPAEALAELRRRILARALREERRRRRRQMGRIAAIAASLLVAVTAGFVTLRRAGIPEGADPAKNSETARGPEIARGPETARGPEIAAVPGYPTAPGVSSGEIPAIPHGSSNPVPGGSRHDGEKADRQAERAGQSELAEAPEASQSVTDPDKPPHPDEECSAACPAEEPGASYTQIPFDEIVVVAYGTGRKSEFTGSISAKQEAGSRPDTAGGKPAAEVDVTEFRKDVEPRLTAPVPPEEAEDLPFVNAETPPRFQGQDINGFRKWVQERMPPSKIVLGSGIPGRVVVSFVIDTTGRLTQIRILQSPDRSLSDEVVRVLKQSPRWEPGRQLDRKVPVKCYIPVDFRPRQQPTKQDRNRN